MQNIDIDKIERLGKIVSGSGMFNCENEMQGCVGAIECLHLDISLMGWGRRHCLIKGREGMKAEAMAAAFIDAGGTITNKVRTDTKASATFTYNGEVFDLEYTFEDAVKAGWTVFNKGTPKEKPNQNYINIPKNMLWARLMSDSIGFIAPHVRNGCYTPEELGDIETDSSGNQDTTVSESDLDNLIPDTDVIINEPEPDQIEETAAEDTEPEEETPEKLPDIDSEFALCPIGQLKGKRWDSMPIKTLEMAFGSTADLITAKHKLEIEAAIEKVKLAAKL